MKLLFKCLIMSFGLSLLVACTPDISPNTYTVDAASSNVAQQAHPGVVVEARPVKVAAPSNNGQTGTLVGGGAGAILGSAIGGDWRTNALGAIAGGVAGGLAGKLIGDRTGSQTGFQYVVKLKNGHMLSVIQGGQPLAVGQHVLVLTGGGAPARVIPQ